MEALFEAAGEAIGAAAESGAEVSTGAAAEGEADTLGRRLRNMGMRIAASNMIFGRNADKSTGDGEEDPPLKSKFPLDRYR